MQRYILQLMDQSPVILVRGNHEDLYEEMVIIDEGLPIRHHVSNGTYWTALQLTGDPEAYERWAKSFNLKQMAQTVLYLQEHNLLNYADLAEKAESSSVKFRKLSNQIKDAETRMAEISVLRTHIVNYAKTREVYVGYRKAGYSKKYLAEHEADILLHKAAKKYFNESGIQKLPSVKSLNMEYTELLAKKKDAYADYRQIREEMRELLVVKANVDRILGIEKNGATQKEEPNKNRS